MNLRSYPSEPPRVVPVSVILHPNISFDDDSPDMDPDQLCLNVLDEWHEYEGELRLNSIKTNDAIFIAFEKLKN